jgi:hypothetical protein
VGLLRTYIAYEGVLKRLEWTRAKHTCLCSLLCVPRWESWTDIFIQASFYVYGSWETVIGTVTRLGLDNRGIVVYFLVGTEYFSLLQSIRTMWPTQPPADCLSRASCPGLKWLGNEADHLLSSRADIKTDWNYSSTTPYAFRARRKMTLPFKFYVCDGYRPGYLSQYSDSLRTGGPGDRIPRGRDYPHPPDRPWGPPSLLYNGYRVFPRGKTAGPWRWPPIPSISLWVVVAIIFSFLTYVTVVREVW